MRRHQPEVLCKGERVGLSVPDLILFDPVFVAARVIDCIMDHVRGLTAALADRHLRAEKKELRGRTTAAVRLLDEIERVAEIARMLAGETVPETAVRHARELLAQAGNR